MPRDSFEDDPVLGPHSGIYRIAGERLRQFAVLGYTSEHDAQYNTNELCDAALCYILWCEREPVGHDYERFASLWPWDRSMFHRSPHPIRNLIKAGALIAAEIDRRRALEPLADSDTD